MRTSRKFSSAKRASIPRATTSGAERPSASLIVRSFENWINLAMSSSSCAEDVLIKHLIERLSHADHRPQEALYSQGQEEVPLERMFHSSCLSSLRTDILSISSTTDSCQEPPRSAWVPMGLEPKRGNDPRVGENESIKSIRFSHCPLRRRQWRTYHSCTVPIFLSSISFPDHTRKPVAENQSLLYPLFMSKNVGIGVATRARWSLCREKEWKPSSGGGQDDEEQIETEKRSYTFNRKGWMSMMWFWGHLSKMQCSPAASKRSQHNKLEEDRYIHRCWEKYQLPVERWFGRVLEGLLLRMNYCKDIWTCKLLKELVMNWLWCDFAGGIENKHEHTRTEVGQDYRPMKGSIHSIDYYQDIWIITHTIEKFELKEIVLMGVWVERIGYDVGLLVELNAKMNIQLEKLWKIPDRWRDRSTQLILIKKSEQNNRKKERLGSKSVMR